jgi:hypothetical protein
VCAELLGALGSAEQRRTPVPTVRRISAEFVDIQLRTVGPVFVDKQRCGPALLFVVRTQSCATERPRDRVAPVAITAADGESDNTR